LAIEAFGCAVSVERAALDLGSASAGFGVARVGAARFRVGTALSTSFEARADDWLGAAVDWVGALRATEPVPRPEACSGPAGGVSVTRRALPVALPDFSWAAAPVLLIGRDGDVAEVEEAVPPRRPAGIRTGSAVCGSVERDELRAPTGVVGEGAARREPARGALELVFS
jgi:hypothetical protein